MVYHYTSIENLALILESKKIRFTRLDKVDDMKEIEGLPLAFSTYVFLSCWTYEEEESIPLWKMYTNNMRGVRIEFPIDMFEKKITKAGVYQDCITVKDDIQSPLTIDEKINEKYIVVNFFGTENSFYKKVIYDDNYPDYYKNSINIENGNTHIDNIFKFGNYKKTIWRFQKESRFTLYAIPLLNLNHHLVSGERKKQLELINYSVNNNIPNEIEYIDLDLDQEVVNNVKLKLGPLCTASDKIIVDSLLNKYTQNGSSESSNLNGSIRK